MPRIKQFPRLNYHFTRGIQELLTEGRLSTFEWNQVLTFFEKKCAYCGIVDTGNPRTGLVADHLLPASEHGELVLGNTVPACHDCNDLRGKTNWHMFLQDAFPDEATQRIQRIQAYLDAFPYQPPADPISRLTAGEQAEYGAIQEAWSLLLTRARQLRDTIKERKQKEPNQTIPSTPQRGATDG